MRAHSRPHRPLAASLPSHLPRAFRFAQHRTPPTYSSHPAFALDPAPCQTSCETLTTSRNTIYTALSPLSSDPAASQRFVVGLISGSSAPPTQRTHTLHNPSASITNTKNPSLQQCLTNTTTGCLTTLQFRRMRRTTLTATTAAAGGARESPRRMRIGNSRLSATSRRSLPSHLRTLSTCSAWRLRRASSLTMTSSSARSTS